MEQTIIDFIVVVLGILFALLLNKIIEKRAHRKRINNIYLNSSKDKYLTNEISPIFKLISSIPNPYIDIKKRTSHCES